MKLLLLIFSVFLTQIISAQQVQVLTPKKVEPITEDWDLSKLPKWQKYKKAIKRYNEGGDQLVENRDFLHECESEFYDDADPLLPWDITTPGCSWYCGAVYETKVSSALESNRDNHYGKDELFDYDLTTAWVEGVSGYGVGEYIEFTFENDAPRATECLIYNGYSKSNAIWKNNSRVKTFDVYENGKLIATMNLADIRGLQVFDLPYSIGRREDGKASHLKFVIKEVYKGDKYEDTAISEFYFDGIDVH